MKNTTIFPEIANVSDLRYNWRKLAKILQEERPVLLLEYSTPKAVIFPFEKVKELFQKKSKTFPKDDLLIKWREKYARQFKGWDATAVIRKMRDLRWNLS